jgi:hypothetical protein
MGLWEDLARSSLPAQDLQHRSQPAWLKSRLVRESNLDGLDRMSAPLRFQLGPLQDFRPRSPVRQALWNCLRAMMASPMFQ